MSDITSWFGTGKRLSIAPTHLRLTHPIVGDPECLGGGSPTEALGVLRDILLDISSDLKLLPIAVTISFRDEVLFKYNEHYMVNMVDKILKGTKNVLRYCMVVDYSKVGRFHMHGVILLHDILKSQYVKNKITKECGNVKFKNIDNAVKWSDYCVELYTKEGKKGMIVKPKHLKYITSH